MSEDQDLPAHRGWYDDGQPPGPSLRIDLLLIERAIGSNVGPWKVGGALLREPGKSPEWVPGWVDETWVGSPETLYSYFVEKGGGNGVTMDVAFLKIASPSDAPKIAAHFNAELRKGNPFGLTETTPIAVPTPEPSLLEADDDEEAFGPCRGHVHVKMPIAAADPLSWRLAAELVRRHPEELWVLRTYPAQYDLLSIRRLPDVLSSPSIDINRTGTHVFISPFNDPTSVEGRSYMSWGNAYAANDPRDWLIELELTAGLQHPVGQLPPSTRSSLVVRWIAAFLAMQTGARTRWSAWNDWCEPDEVSAGFTSIPGAAEWLRSRGGSNGAAFVLFVGEMTNDERRPEFALSVDGQLWRGDQEAVALPAAYQSAGSSITSLIAASFGDLLP